MAQKNRNDNLRTFDAERSRLVRLAYSMTGSMHDAEDVVQDAWLRWQGIDSGTLDCAAAFLTKVVVRRSIDYLRKRRRHSSLYPGEWLPEPSIDAEFNEMEPILERDVTFALLVAFERLSPLERAVFILKDIFDMGFSEIAALLERNEAACRQLAKRARNNVRDNEPRFKVARADQVALANAFFRASQEGDEKVLMRLLAGDVVLHSDGGGRRLAALNPIVGANKVARFYCGLARKTSVIPHCASRYAFINGQFAQLATDAKGTRQATLINFGEERISSIYLLRNPEKISHLWMDIPNPARTS